jgi:hypothetical protein
MPETESIKRPIVLSADELRTNEILILQPAYPLDENNFNKLKNGSSGCKDWAQKVLFMSIGWAFKIVSALIVFLIAYSASKTNDKIVLEIKLWEIVSVGLALFVCLILYIIGHFVKNEKDKLIESIDSHFKKRIN